jgi:cell wall assembly regulator SMI1
MLRLHIRGQTPRSLGPWKPAVHHALGQALRAGLRPFQPAPHQGMLLSVLHALVHGRPILFDGEVLDRAALDDAAVEVAIMPFESARPRKPAVAITAALDRLASTFTRLAPDAPAWCKGPAWHEHVVLLERTLNRKIPDDLLELVARCDGSDNGIGLGRWELESVQEIESSWVLLQGIYNSFDSSDLEDLADGPMWRDSWLPFAHDGTGNHLCLDIDAACDGNAPVFELIHDDVGRPRVADSLSEWIVSQANALEIGLLVVIENIDGSFATIIERDGLRHGEMAAAHVRGESRDARISRIARDVLADPDRLTQFVQGIILGNGVTLKPGCMPMKLWDLIYCHMSPNQSEPNSDISQLSLRLRCLFPLLKDCPEVEEVSLTADELVAAFTADIEGTARRR